MCACRCTKFSTRVPTFKIGLDSTVLMSGAKIAAWRPRRALARDFVNFTLPLGRSPSLLDEPRFILGKKAEVSKRQYSSKAKGFNIRDFFTAKNTVHQI